MAADKRFNDTAALVACSAALLTLVPVTLFQTGVIDTLPDPPLNLFDSERITSSKDAHPLGVPDGILGLASYGVTLSLILLARKHPVARPVLGAKLIVDGGMAGTNVVKQVVSFGKMCSWCTGTAVATFAMVWAGRSLIQSAAATAETVYDSAHQGTLLQNLQQNPEHLVSDAR